MKKKYDYLVFIGRMQPVHLAHIEVMKQALTQADYIIVLIGSSAQPRTVKNPFTWQEREAMLKAALPTHIHDRMIALPIHDVTYNDQQWTKQVQTTVQQITGPNANIGIIGHTKDDSSYYLKMFPQWKLTDVDNIEDIHASDIREAYFTADSMDDFSAKIGNKLPVGIYHYLETFMKRVEYGTLVNEYNFIVNYKKAWEPAPYAPTFVTVDAVVIQSGHVLLVKRRAEPGKGLWAISGGFLNQDERTLDGAIRELKEETQIKVPIPVLKGSVKSTFIADHPERSLRGRTISHVFCFELPPGELPKVKGSDDAEKAKWIPLSTFAKMENQMFEDHFHVVNHFIGE